MKTPKVLLDLGIEYDPRFNFDKETHQYTWEGREMTGTTSILKGIKNPDALLGWASALAVKAMLAGASPEEAKKAYITKRDARKDDGINTHAMIEEYIKDRVENHAGVPVPLDDSHPHYYAIGTFAQWAVDEGVTFLGSEFAVYYRDGFVGGIVDFLFEKEGKVYIGDIKTNKKPRYGSGIYYSYFLQLASYRNALESMGATKEIAGYAVCRIGNTSTTDFEVMFRENYKADKEAFLGALAIYRSTRDYESIFK